MAQERVVRRDVFQCRLICLVLTVICVPLLVFAVVVSTTTYSSRVTTQTLALAPLDDQSLESRFTGIYLLSNDGLIDPTQIPIYKFRAKKDRIVRRVPIRAEDYGFDFNDEVTPSVLILKREVVAKKSDFVPRWFWSKVQLFSKQSKPRISYQFTVPSWSVKGEKEI